MVKPAALRPLRQHVQHPHRHGGALQLRRCLRLGGMLHERHREPPPFYLNTSDPNDTGRETPRTASLAAACTCGFGAAGIGMFYRNSNTRIADVTDGLSNTITVGERCTAHSPTTWVGAVTGARCPAWMATSPWTTPYTPPSAAPGYRKWHRLRQCGLRRSLVPRPRQLHAQAQQRQPALRPRCVLEHAHQVDAISCSATARCISSRRPSTGRTYQYLMTIAGGEIINGDSY